MEVSLEVPTVTEPSFRELPEDEPVHKFSEVQSGDISLEDFVAQMTEDELITFLSGGNYRKDDGIKSDFLFVHHVQQLRDKAGQADKAVHLISTIASFLTNNIKGLQLHPNLG